MTPDDCACPCHWGEPGYVLDTCTLMDYESFPTSNNCYDSCAEWKKGHEDEP